MERPADMGMTRPFAAQAAAERAERPTLEALFRAHADSVHRTVRRLLGPGASAADVQDLTQQVFLAAHRMLPRFRGDSAPSTWLYGIAVRTVLVHLRSRKRHRRMVETLEARPERAGPPSAEARLSQQQELEVVWRCLMRIAPKKRVVFILHEIEGRSGPEIAEALEVKLGTVWTRLHHAKRELDEALAKEKW